MVSSFLLRLLIVVVAMLTCCASDKALPREEILTFESGDATLEGTLNIPGNGEKFPVVVFIHGSGMRTRDDFQSFVKSLNDAGVATFRYDKRGVGKSGGTYTDVGTFNSERMFSVLAGDAVAAINHLRTHRRIDTDKIIVAGVSQEGWIIPEINTMADVYLSICISGPLVSVGEEIYYSDLAEHGIYAQTKADSLLQYYDGPKGFEPVRRIAKMKNPSLWLFGGKDVSIPVRRSIYVLDSLRSNGGLPLEMKLFPEADHGLYNVTTHRREDYVSLMVDWLKEKL